MSYEKAMKHARNIRKLKKQSRMYMGFDVSSGRAKPSPQARELECKRMEVRRWFKDRHDGDLQYNRECIRESIVDLKLLLSGFGNQMNKASTL